MLIDQAPKIHVKVRALRRCQDSHLAGRFSFGGSRLGDIVAFTLTVEYGFGLGFRVSGSGDLGCSIA